MTMDRLDQLIKECSQHSSKEHVEMFDLLIELKERRESDLRPADKYLGATTWEQIIHVKSEWREVDEAYKDFFKLANGDNYKELKSNLIEELIDLQMSCETMLAILGLDENQRREERRNVIEKNRKRGYYEVKHD